MTALVEREAIARIVDPAAWADHDYWSGRLRGDGQWPNDAEQVAAMMASYKRRMPERVAPSLAKADAILALRQPGAEYRRAVEACEVVAQRALDMMRAQGSLSDDREFDGAIAVAGEILASIRVLAKEQG